MGNKENVFQVLDHSGRGKIQVNMLRQLLTRFGAKVPPEELDQLLAEVNDLQEINYDQFMDVITKPTDDESSL